MKLSERSKAIITLIIMVATVVNQCLQLTGFDPIPFAPEKVEMVLSTIATAIAIVYGWWKNQNFTKEAEQAQGYLEELKDFKKLKG